MKAPSLLLLVAGLLAWQAVAGQATEDAQEDSGESPPVADSVNVRSVAADDEISSRLQAILETTGWFADISVTVETGVVFLQGSAADEEQRTWAGNLARNTEDVAAVVNNIAVREASPWDLSPALEQMRELLATAVRNLPLVLVGVLLFLATWALAGVTFRVASRMFGRRVESSLLRDVLARAIAALVLVLGLYVVLRISGLTGLAVTIVGGTGLLGLAIGFAFRDIAENFLASILISIQRPFAMGDLIEVDGQTGFVQRVNTRATLIMTRDGNHVQVPNATVYKNTITNFTANPKGREDFVIGIGYDDSISAAQSTAYDVLRAHAAVLDEPEPTVLVEQLAASTVNLRVSFWLDISEFDQLKVRSAVIRQTKAAFIKAGVSMPDESREIIFPQGVPVEILKEDDTSRIPLRPLPDVADDASEAHRAEGNLVNDDEELEKQARAARLPEGGKNLL